MNKFIYTLFALLLLTGCWDQTNLNETKLITAGGIDYTKKGRVTSTVAVPQAVAAEAGTGNIVNQVFAATGNTARQSRLMLDRKVAERLDASKNQVLVFGEETAKTDIYNLLDVFYRDPKSSLNAKLAIAKGKASDLISTSFEEPKKSTGVGEYLRDSIKSAEEGATVPEENIQTICPLMFDPGQDFALPYLKSTGKAVKVVGVALFHEHQMVGSIKEPLSVIYTMLTGKPHTISMSTTKKISNNQKENLLNYATIKVEKNKRKFDVYVSSKDKISAKIKLNIKVIITEYPFDNLSTPSEIKKLEKLISKKLTEDAQKVIDKLQKMNSDPLGVGRRLMAYHYPTWEKLNWKEEYPKIDFKATVDVDVIGHGIIE
jgi:Ger(x)C family germination protein